MMKNGRYEEKNFSKNRRNISLLLEEGSNRHIIHAMAEIDVTKAREIIHKSKEDISFTGWIIKCFATVMTEKKEFNSLMHRKKKIIIFQDVDVAIPVEREANGEKRPMAYVIRKANEKNIMELTKEIRSVQKEDVDKSTQILGKNLTWMEKFALNSPMFIKKILMSILKRNAFLKKKYMGTTAVTSVGMMGKLNGWILIIGGHYTTQMGVGGIIKRLTKNGDKIEFHEYLAITVSVNHDIIDGAPLARFVSRLSELMENAYGLQLK